MVANETQTNEVFFIDPLLVRIVVVSTVFISLTAPANEKKTVRDIEMDRQLIR